MRIILLAFIFSLTSFGAGPEAKYVKLVKPKAVDVSEQAPGEGVVSFKVDKGYHVQANPASKPNLIATTLTLTTHPQFDVAVPVYPVGKPWRLPGAEEEVATYEGLVEIRFPIKAIAGAAKPGNTTIEGKLRYQACDAKTCYFPMTIPVSIPILVK